MDSVVKYYTNRGSPVFVASLDATKALDRENHYAFFHKILLIGVPIALLNVLMYWHLNLKSCILWCDAFCPLFCIKSGVRQGEIIFQNGCLMCI